MQKKLIIAFMLCFCCLGCASMKKIGNELGRISTTMINVLPEVRREIIYVAFNAYKQDFIKHFNEYKKIEDEVPPTYFRITDFTDIIQNPSSKVAQISGIVLGDGYQDRKYRGRVYFTFKIQVTTAMDFLGDWDGKQVLLALDPQFIKIKIKHDYTGLSILDGLLTFIARIEKKTLYKIQKEKGGYQNWLIKKIGEQWKFKRVS